MSPVILGPLANLDLIDHVTSGKQYSGGVAGAQMMMAADCVGAADRRAEPTQSSNSPPPTPGSPAEAPCPHPRHPPPPPSPPTQSPRHPHAASPTKNTQSYIRPHNGASSLCAAPAAVRAAPVGAERGARRALTFNAETVCATNMTCGGNMEREKRGLL